ncbi:hypothetical protein [Campylobacter mucosalis]|uniref:hypothetical protein n=1 Tax=Campylobacter mucosalis TaxID=202 RepID=UPI0004D9256B|nr:hypothetical protein [Campylobacter mucosalis]KEA46606.1 hypothetical protein CR66_01870 [Campylobacter mucosalis]QKF62886.1 hypothetical protein CMCT_0745 [Campylobacter mucosalis]
MNNLLTTTRRPADHFVSGALIAGIGTLSMNLNEPNKAILAKKVLKVGLIGGITTASAIYASNQIATSKYLNAVLSIGVSVGAVIAINNLIKEK